MSASELQACLSRLYVDECFRKLFYIQPDILSEYGLDAAELDAVLHIDRRKLDFFAGSLRQKRRRRIARAYPALFRLDGEVLDRYYRRYYEIFTARSESSFRSEVDAFGTFMWESLVDEKELPPYARELVRYEHYDFLARSGREHAAVADSFTPTAPIEDPARPELADGVMLCHFCYDIPAIEDALLRDGPEGALAIAVPGVHSFVFFPLRQLGGTTMLRLSGPLSLVLDRCDGNRSIGEIVKAVEGILAADALMRPTVDALEQCVSLGVLRMLQ
jgi:hypothetical protein